MTALLIVEKQRKKNHRHYSFYNCLRTRRRTERMTRQRSMLLVSSCWCQALGCLIIVVVVAYGLTSCLLLLLMVHRHYLFMPQNTGMIIRRESSWTLSRFDMIDKKMPDAKQESQMTTTLAKTLDKDHKEEDNFLPRVLAFVFPQFHRDPINDKLWGEGFTDWDSLRQAPVRNRLGYTIPRPTELGFYNYTDWLPREQQGQLAREYNLDGFIFHHYWFYDEDHPGPNLHAPLMEMLQDGQPNVSFALHWCASKWVSTWNGKVRDDFKFKEPGVLQKQYFPSNATDPRILQHYQWLRQFFHQENYIKVHGRPLFMIYQRKPSSFLVLEKLSQLAQQDGFPDGLYLTVGLTMPHSHLQDIGDNNMKSQYENRPQQSNAKTRQYFDKVLAYPNPTDWNRNRPLQVPDWCQTNKSSSSSSTTTSSTNQNKNQKRVDELAGIITSFDNTPRRNLDQAHLWSAAEPDVVVERFRQSLQAALFYEACCFLDDRQQRWKKPRVDDDRFVVINAMNEWAEGMALEPSDVYGRRFLQVIRDVKRELNSKRCLSGY